MGRNRVLQKYRSTMIGLVLMALGFGVCVYFVYRFILTPFIFYNPDPYATHQFIVIGLNCENGRSVIINNLDGQYLTRGSREALEIVTDICEHNCEPTMPNVTILSGADINCK